MAADFSAFARPGSRAAAPIDRAVLNDVTRSNGGTLSDLFWLLDTPGAIVRGTVSGVAQGDPLKGLRAPWESEDDRVSGRDLNAQLGLDPTPGDKTWANFSTGIATEILTDPLSYLSGPIKALTPAGKVAAKAGLLAQAPEILSRQVLAGQAAPEVAEAAARTVRSIGRDVSPTDIIGRPLLGPRAARRAGTLGDLMDFAPDPAQARENVLTALGGKLDRLESLRKQKLGRSFGLGLPFADPMMSFDDPVGIGSTLGSAFDALGQAVRWGPAGRAYNMLTNADVGGAWTANDQMISAGSNIAKRRAMQTARRDATFQAAKLQQAEPDVFSEEGNRVLGRLIERPKDSAFKQSDAVWESSHPAARAYMQWWDDQAKQANRSFTEAGLRGVEFKDPFIEGYLPRKAEGMLEMAGARDASLGRQLSSLTSDQLQRADEMMVPGGRDTLAFDLSRDPVVAGAKRSAKTDREAAEHIATKLYGTPTPENMKQATTLAQLLHKLPDHLIRQVPLFGQHPVEMATRYLEGRAGAEAMQGSLYDSLAYMAANSPAELAEQGRHISMKEALARIGARTVQEGDQVLGAAVQMRERLAKRYGLNADSVELATFSVPEELVERLVRARDAYTSPEGASQMMEALRAYQSAWKSHILTWPSRIVRDLYSGAYSNWLEGALSRRSVHAAKGLLSRGPDDPAFVQMLAKMPLYGGGADDAVARFWADLDATGLMQSSVSNDRGLIIAGQNVVDSLPGAMPDTFAGALSELGPQKGRTWGEFVDAVRPRLFPDRATLERNPMVRAGARAGNLSDRINRLSGYMELLSQGVAPQEAARRMMRAHVDYSSLTPYERNLRDTAMPFYAYFSRSLREVMRQMAERPGGRYGQGLRVYERAQEPEDGEYIPASVRKNFAARIESDDPIFGMFAPQSDEITRFLTDIDLPGYDQINLVRPRNIPETLRNIASQANPLIRAGFEIVSGTDAFTGRPLNQATYGPLNNIVQAAGGPPRSVWPIVERAVDLVPGVSRPMRAVSNFVNPNLPIGVGSRVLSSAINNMTGIKFRDFTQEDMDRDAIRRLEELAQPYTAEHATRFVPKEQRPFVPQDVLSQVDVANQLRNRLQSARRDRLQKLKNPFERQ